MPSISQSFEFFIESDVACWNGDLTRFELKLLQTLPSYALEQLRSRFLFFVTSTRIPKMTARSTFQLAFETEIGAALYKVAPITIDVQESHVCERRRYLEIDQDMASFQFLLRPALNAATFLPPGYVKLLSRHLASPYARYRVCATAALLCFAAAYLVPDVSYNLTVSKSDTVGTTDGALALPGAVRVAHDTLSAADTTVRNQALARTPHDTVTATDVPYRQPNSEGVADAVAATDVKTVAVAINKTFSDTATVADAHS